MTEQEVANLKKELRLLHRVAQVVHSLEISEVLKEIITVVDDVCEADSILIYIMNSKTKELVLRASNNPHPDLLQHITMKIGEGITGWVAGHKKPVILSKNANQDRRFKYFHNLPEDTFEAFLSVPIMSKNGVVGVINVQHKKIHEHSDMEVNLLTAIGKLVAGAVENARLIEETLELTEALVLRKLVDKAKGILMKRKHITEDEAYRMLQKESMNMRKSLKEVAEAVLLADKFHFHS